MAFSPFLCVSSAVCSHNSIYNTQEKRAETFPQCWLRRRLLFGKLERSWYYFCIPTGRLYFFFYCVSLCVPICAKESLQSTQGLLLAALEGFAAGLGVSACMLLLGRVVGALGHVLMAKGLEAKKPSLIPPHLITEPREHHHGACLLCASVSPVWRRKDQYPCSGHGITVTVRTVVLAMTSAVALCFWDWAWQPDHSVTSCWGVAASGIQRVLFLPFLAM